MSFSIKTLGGEIMSSIPRCEHPKPQMQRNDWMNLNGEWDFAFDFGTSGIDRKLYEKKTLDNKITVPFCPESELSGIGHKDFIPAVWRISIIKELVIKKPLVLLEQGLCSENYAGPWQPLR